MPSPPKNSRGRSIKSVKTTFNIIEALRDQRSVRLTELAGDVGVSKTTAYHHLATLREIGYVKKHEGEYRLTLLFLHLGEQTQASNRIYQNAKSTVDELAEACDEKVQLVVEENGYAFYLYKAQGEQAVGRDFHVGQRDLLHHSAGGKAILAHLPKNRVEQIIAQRSLPSLTRHTITDREELFAALETIRERGYSLNLEEEVNGVHAIGAPILGADGEILASLSISGPMTRLPEDRLHGEMAQLVKNGVNLIEIELNTSD